MIAKGMTIKEATERWVYEFNKFPQDMIQKLMESDIDSWNEVTKPSYGSRVYVFNLPENCEDCSMYGEIEKYLKETNKYRIRLDNGSGVEVEEDDFEMENYCDLPMYGYMWQFDDSADDYWLEELDGIQKMSDCGFRIYENDEWGYVFGIDGCGYDFYEAHWIPLYKERGLRWHDPETEDRE